MSCRRARFGQNALKIAHTSGAKQNLKLEGTGNKPPRLYCLRYGVECCVVAVQ